jgi:hypothetical protein
MKSLRDEIRLAAGYKDGFDFIHKVDLIGVSRFHPCASKDFTSPQGKYFTEIR